MMNKRNVKLFVMIGCILLLAGCKADGSSEKIPSEVEVNEVEVSEEASEEETCEEEMNEEEANDIEKTAVKEDNLVPEEGKQSEEEAYIDDMDEAEEGPYESFRDFPYGNMKLVDDVAYAFLKDIYDNIDFYGEFQLGDISLYEEYTEEYKKLVNSQRTFENPDTGEECYLKDYKCLLQTGNGDLFDPHELVYYLFDMDEDGNPEICIWDYATYIFKYDKKSDKMLLWSESPSAYERIHGTRKLIWNWDGVRYTLCELDEQGNLDMGVYFMVDIFYGNGVKTYLVTVPRYADQDNQIEIPDEIVSQGYFDGENHEYMFPVTEEQFDELTGDFFEAEEQSDKAMDQVGYCYDELFGDGELCEQCDRNMASVLDKKTIFEANNIKLSRRDIRLLENMGNCIPYSYDSQNVGEECYAGIINCSVLGPLAHTAESVGEPKYMAKISRESMEAYVKKWFGKELPDGEYPIEEVQEGKSNFYYEDGYYYIGWFDWLDITYEYVGCKALNNGNVMVEYDLHGAGEGWTMLLELAPADNENGYIIVGRKNVET